MISNRLDDIRSFVQAVREHGPVVVETQDAFP